ncbi:Unknown protein, partial [Striga hermonthica]
TSSNPDQVVQLQSQLITVKLSDTNYLIWQQQVLAAVRGYGLMGYLDGSLSKPAEYMPGGSNVGAIPNPLFSTWVRQDQLLASWLLSSLSESVLISTVGLITSKEIWESLKITFASQNQAKIMQYRLQLQTFKKGNLSMRDYLSKVKQCCDLLASAGQKIDETDQIAHIISGLGSEYNAIMVSLASRSEPCTLREVHSILLSFESRLEATEGYTSHNEETGFSVNLAAQGHNTNFKRGGFQGMQRGRGSNQGFQARGRGRQGNLRGRGISFNNGKVRCQICHYNNHTVERCYFRSDLNLVPKNFNSPPQESSQQATNPSVNMMNFENSETGSDTYWYPDSGATNHLTFDMNNLNIAADYQGNEKVQMGNGKGLNISHYGNSYIISPYQSSTSFTLKNLLHVPKITKNLISVSQLCKDNSVFFEFHPNFCIVKDQETKQILLKGKLDNGLYKFHLETWKNTLPSQQYQPTAEKLSSFSAS